MEEQFVLTITIINETEGPLLRFKSNGDEIRTAKFAALCSVFKDLTEAALEAHIGVANQVAVLANKHSQCVCDESEDESED